MMREYEGVITRPNAEAGHGWILQKDPDEFGIVIPEDEAERLLEKDEYVLEEDYAELKD